MGEYVQFANRTIKLGTCEDLYYMRHDQTSSLWGCQQLPGNLPPEEYANPKNGFRYRFPFPDEDALGLGEFDDFDRGLCFPVPPAFVADIKHNTINHSCHVQKGGYNVNVSIPCPATLQPGTLKHSPIPPVFPLEIIQQKHIPNEGLWTVCRCGWCHSVFRLPQDEGCQLAEMIEAEYDDPKDERFDFWRKIASRIVMGYTIDGAAVAG